MRESGNRWLTERNAVYAFVQEFSDKGPADIDRLTEAQREFLSLLIVWIYEPNALFLQHMRETGNKQDGTTSAIRHSSIIGCIIKGEVSSRFFMDYDCDEEIILIVPLDLAEEAGLISEDRTRQTRPCPRFSMQECRDWAIRPQTLYQLEHMGYLEHSIQERERHFPLVERIRLTELAQDILRRLIIYAVDTFTHGA